MPDTPVILLAEPEDAVRESIEIILIEEGYDCHSVSNTPTFIQALQTYNADLIIADVNLVYDDIKEILNILKSYHRPDRPEFMVMLGYERIRDMLYLMKFGVTDYLIKPFSFEEMIDRVQRMTTLSLKKIDK